MKSVVEHRRAARLDRRSLIALIALAALGGAAQAQYFNCGANCHVVNGSVSDGAGGPFLAGHVYIANGSLSVPTGATLTIGAGAIIKFDGVHALNVYGTLIANGVSGSPIIVTSLHDDVGGDHNGNAGATAPAPGQWIQTWFGPSSSASQIAHMTLRYAGWGGHPSVFLDASNSAFSNCEISSPGGDCISFNNNSAPTMTGCSFIGGSKAASAVPLTSLPGFSGCTATGQTLRDAPEVVVANVTASLSISVDDTFNGSGVVVLGTSPTVQTTGTLTLQPGVTFKFAGVHAFNVYGTLLTNGTSGSPVTLTSIDDDTVGGDTNRNGAASAPSPGQWIQLWMGPASDASSLTGLRVKCAGWGGNSVVKLDQSNAALDDVRTSLAGGSCLDLNANSYPTATNCRFDGGSQAIVNMNIAALPGFSGCTAVGNTTYNAPEVTVGSIGPGVNLAIVPDDALNGDGVVVFHTSVSVDATATLNLTAGVKFKFTGVHAFNVYGGLTTTGSTGNPVVLTSIHDDVYGGDTNLNLGGTAGSPGQWIQAWFGPSSDASNLAGLLVRCAGWGGNPSIKLDQSNLTMTDTSTALSGGPCLDLSNNSYPTIAGGALNGGNYALTNVRIPALAGLSGVAASGNSVFDVPYVTSGAVNVGEDTTLTTTNTLNGNGVVACVTSINVATGATLTLDAGLVVKFVGVHALNVSGVLTTNGTTTPTSAGVPVVFTSINDDAYGGDTNKDGAATSPSPGQWIQAWFGPSSGASMIAGAVFRSGGWGGNPMIQLSQSNLVMSNSKTGLSGGPCIDLANNSFPSLSFCKFDGGTFAAHSVPLAALAGFKQNTATGNSAANAPYVTSATVGIGQTVVVRSINAFNQNGVVALAASMTIAAGGTLDVGAGVVFKFNGVHAVTHYGTAFFRGTGVEPVVFTSWSDDSMGGDSNLNGGSAASPGQWIQIYVGAGAAGSYEHVRIRAGGWGGNDMVEAHAPGVAWNACRFDLSGGRGLRVTAAANGEIDNMVAWACSSTGIRLETGQQIRHATAANCGGAGLQTNHPTAAAINCVSFGNGGVGYSGFSSGFLNASCGTGWTGGTANLTVDPQFVNAAAGNLELSSTSPVIDLGELGTAFAIVYDHVDACRISDGLLVSAVAPDMGAFEHVAYRMTVTGKPWSYGSMTLQVDGSQPGVAYVAFGLGGPPLPIIPYGFLNLGPIDQIVLLAFVSTGAPFTATIPDVAAFAGNPFRLQALATPLVNPSVGSFTNTYFGAIDE